jgi:3-hydroxyisobutyrate dehydrogenase-like beta-hydroxyacid dehydrogenase
VQPVVLSRPRPRPNDGFTVALGLKEVRLILSPADMQHVPLPAAHVLHDRLLNLVANADGGKDWGVHRP